MKKFSVFLALLCLTMCISTTSLAAKFYDTKGTEYEGMVDRIAALGIINGVSEKTFAPNKGLTRAEFAKIITYTKGMQKFADETDLPSKFKDVKKNHWAKNYIMVAEDMGFLKGYEDGTFRPEQEVTYAEFIAITLRVLGYVNIDETSGSTWYSGYIKRMIEIDLNDGMPEFKSYDAPAKRGDVAIMWWNMLVSDRWAIDAQSEGSGLHYTYSSKTQLEFLFPDFIYVRGKVTSMYNPRSGDAMGVEIGGYSRYKTHSNVPLYALGASATGLYDPDTKELYGFAIDEEYENFEWISGPIFYLEQQGIKLKSAKVEASYGSKNDANYAYALLSKEDNSVLRVVYLDASDSWFVTSVKTEVPKDEDGKAITSDDDELEEFKLVYINGEEDAIASNNAVVVVNGEKVEWEDIPENAVLTELVPYEVYTIETKTVSGVVTDYSKMSDLYIDYDRYIVADSCIYTIYGETENAEGKKTDKLKTFKYTSLKKQKFEELLSRKVIYRLNVAEEIQCIEFGRYKPSSIIDKYDNGEYRFFFVDSLGYSGSGEDLATIGGKSFGGKVLRYKVKDSDDLKKGAFVFVSELENTPVECKVLESSNSFDDDLALEYDIQDKYSYGGFGEYAMTDDTLVFQVLKYYKENSIDEVEKVTMQRVERVEDIENLDKYKIHLLYNEEMNIDIVLAERELNKAVYPVGRIMEIWNYSPDDDSDAEKKLVKVKVGTVGDASFIAVAYVGDCQWGELVTYDPETKEDYLRIKERFRTEFLGYKGDIVIESASKRDHTATVVGESNILDLREQTYEYKGKSYDLLDYKYLLTTVRYDSEYDSWGFMLTKFYEKEDLELKAGDRIAFNELNGIAVIYRGYTD